MKYNQFAKKQTNSVVLLNELRQLDLYPDELNQASLRELAYYIYQQFNPEHQADFLSRLLVNPEQNLADYLDQVKTTFSQQAFYNVALQLLGFFTPQDFNLQAPLVAMTSMRLPYLPQSQFKRDDFLQAIYLLLNTRSQNGALFLDNLASRGYFREHFSAAERQKPYIFNGKAQAVFDRERFVTEVVYVESDLDTDQDGQSDLLETTIVRPQLDNPQQQLPALYTANPYFKGTTDSPMNPVDVDFQVKSPGDARQDRDDFDQFTQPQHTDKSPSKTASKASQTVSGLSPVTLNTYFLARGFASVYAAGIGTRGSDGIRTCGSPEETQSTIAIIEWLHGDRRAFTDRSRQETIAATWCNGRVAMTGKSYLGTLSLAAATTGVAGLETVISEAAISSWYDYYREHGLVVAPETFQGEDADVLTNECFSRQKDAGDFQNVKPFYKKKLAQMRHDQDRRTGSYNHFWNIRNYRRQLDQVRCPIVSVHGLNDWNVKPKNVFKLNQDLQKLGKMHKVILHQGPHIYLDELLSLDFYDLVNLWLSHFLFKVDNQAEQIWPDYLIQSNLQDDHWQTPKTWITPRVQTFNLYDDLKLSDTTTDFATFCDDGVLAFQQSQQTPASWEQHFIQQGEMYQKQQIVLKTERLKQSWLITGRPVVKLRVKSSAPYGLLSVMLVDYGLAHHLTERPQILDYDSRQLSFDGPLANAVAFQAEQTTSTARRISKTHLNLQNRQTAYDNEIVQPDQYYDVDLRLQPTYYHLLPGHQLGLIIYGTDMGATLRHQNQVVYAIDLTHSQLQFAGQND